MKKTAWILSGAALVALAIAGCAALPAGGGSADLDAEAHRMLATGFHDHGIAKMDRITHVDDTVKACNAADISGNNRNMTYRRDDDYGFPKHDQPSALNNDDDASALYGKTQARLDERDDV